MLQLKKKSLALEVMLLHVISVLGPHEIRSISFCTEMFKSNLKDQTE
jgi:hypothetical protein